MRKTRKRLSSKKRFGLSSKRASVVAGVFSVCSLFCSGHHAVANVGGGTFTWTPGGADGGAGVWDTTTANWSGGNTTWVNGSNATFGGTPGTVTIDASGVSANNITVNTGTYLINGGGLTLSGAASIVTNHDARIDSVIAGASGLNKSGAGILNLNAANTYTGATTVTNGMLQNGVDNALPTTTTLTVDGANASYDLNGHGQTVQGFVLSNGGTLNDLPGGGSLFSSSDFDLRSGNVFGVLAGSSGLVKSGTGTVALYGKNKYKGATNITGGVLIAGNDRVLPIGTQVTVQGFGSTLDLNGYTQIVSGLTLKDNAVINDSFTNGQIISLEDFDVQSGTVNGILAGEVGLTKTTKGTVVLNGHNTYGGLTDVQEGKLIINGSIDGPATVEHGATLGGSGVIAKLVINHGTISPGNSPGILTLKGNFVQAANGTLFMQIASASSFDQLRVAGQAKLNGSLQVAFLNGFQLNGNNVFPVVTASSVVGTFSEVSTGTVLNANAIYEPNAVIVQLEQGSFAAATRFEGITPNEQAVAHALDKSVNNRRISKLISFLDVQPIGKLPRAFDLIAPEEYASLFDISIASNDVQTANLERRFEDIRNGSFGFSAAGLNLHGTSQTITGDNAVSIALYRGAGKEGKTLVAPTAAPSDRLGFFITGEGDFVDVNSDGNGSGYDFTTAGTTVGLDYRLSKNFAIGITAGYVHTWTDLVAGGRNTVDGGNGGVYATWFDNSGFYLNGIVGGGYNSYDASRAGLNGTIYGNTAGGEFNSVLGGGYDLHRENWTFGPTADLQYTYVSIDGFQETGGLGASKVSSNDTNSLRSRLGVRAAFTRQCGHISINPEVRVGWQHEFLDRSRAIDSQLGTGAGDIFEVRGPVLGRDSLLVSAGFSLGLSPAVSAFAFYDGQLGRKDYTAHSVSGGLRVNF